MYNIKLTVLAVVVQLLIGCAVAPLSSPSTARSLGGGEPNLMINLVPAGVDWSIGVSSDIDVGLGAESQIAPLVYSWAKYSVVNRPEKGAVALLGGVFYSEGIENSTGQGYYLGPIFSYKAGKAEWYLVPRYNRVNWAAGGGAASSADGSFSFVLEPIDGVFDYFQVNAGLNLWFSEKFGMNVSALCLKPSGQALACVAPLLAIGWRM